jgi:hypothetical protein
MNFLIGHLMGDFLLQTGWMARQKKTRWVPLLAHALVYALAIRLATGWGPVALALVVASHILLDGGDLARQYNAWVKGDASAAWLNLVTDQTLHLLTLYVVDRLPKVHTESNWGWGVLVVAGVIAIVALYRAFWGNARSTTRVAYVGQPYRWLRRNGQIHARKRRSLDMVILGGSSRRTTTLDRAGRSEGAGR